MEWDEKLQKIIDYTENHLQRTEEPLDADEIARMAGCSYSFFQKVFSYMNGISYAEYVRFRKLTLAGYDLKSTERKVVDISYQYGYDSPTSFTKAFQQFHGLSPTEARGRDAMLRVYPKMQISVKQDYSWRLESKPAAHLVGKTRKISCENGQHFQEIPKFWCDCQKDGTYTRLMALDEGSPKGLLGVFGYDKAHPGELLYSMMAVSGSAVPEDFEEIWLPEVTWAVFECRGPVPQAIQKGWKYLNEEWLVKYPFCHAECPEIEWYSDGNSYDEQYVSQIWIPILEEDA